MTNLEFNQYVVTLIAGLWPTYRFPPEMQEAKCRHLGQFAYGDVLAALQTQEREDPDATKPSWKKVIVKLKRDCGENKTDFAILLDQVRTAAAKRGHNKGVEHWSDPDAWQHYLDANTFPITHNTFTRKPHPDPDGRRARLAAQLRKDECYIWTKSLGSQSANVPDFLNEPELPMLAAEDPF